MKNRFMITGKYAHCLTLPTFYTCKIYFEYFADISVKYLFNLRIVNGTRKQKQKLAGHFPISIKKQRHL